MSEYRTREQYWDYKDYLQHREGNCYYNKGLDLKDSNPTETVKFFKLALKEDQRSRLYRDNCNFLLHMMFLATVGRNNKYFPIFII